MDEKTCKNCGRVMPGDSVFCPSCGSPVDAVSEKPYVPTTVRRGEEDMAGPVFGGGVLMLLGMTLWLSSYGIIGWGVWWAYFLCGLGLLLSLLGAFKLRSGKDTGALTGGLIVFSIGLIFILAWEYSLSQHWPLVLIAIGAVIIISSIVSAALKRRTVSGT